MEFNLVEAKKQYSSKDLINDLCRVANELQKKNVTLKEYSDFGKFSYQTLKKRFGSWDNVIKEAGLKERKRQWGGDLSEVRIPEELLISDMKLVAEKLGKQDITISDYDNNGKYGSSVITKRFKGWNNAKKVADLKVGRLYNSTDEDYLENIFEVWQVLGRQPKYQEMVAPLSKLHISSYERKFGTWRKALERFIDYINSKDDIKNIPKKVGKRDFIDYKNQGIKKEGTKIQKSNIKKRSNRTANLRQRFKVMKRDDFKCMLCGDSPAKNPKCELHIDHIVPWSKGGETTLENLQTLCQKCNLGKSNI